MDKMLQTTPEYTTNPIISEQETASGVLPDPISQTGEKVAKQIETWKDTVGIESTLNILSTMDLLKPISEEHVVFDKRYLGMT